MSECAVFTEKLKQFKNEELNRAELRSLQAHLLACAACRNKAFRDDPLRIFSLLSLHQKEKHFWNGYWDRIGGAISAKKVWAWKIPFLQPSPVPVALAMLVLITVMSIVAIVNVGQVEQIAYEPSIPAETGLQEQVSYASQPPIVDTTVQPSARVMTFTVGDTDVVMIFDENMDI